MMSSRTSSTDLYSTNVDYTCYRDNKFLLPFTETNHYHVNKYNPQRGEVHSNIQDLIDLFPSNVFDFDRYFAAHDQSSVLDYNCGSGKALLQLQSKYPKTMTTHCINKKGLKKQQSESYQDLVDVANYYKIALHCNETHFLLPHIHITTSAVEDRKVLITGIPFNHQFDFIYSMALLSNKKTSSLTSHPRALSHAHSHTNIHALIDKLLPLLKTSSDSRMVILLHDITGLDELWNISYTSSSSSNSSLIKTWEYYELLESSFISMSLYIVRSNGGEHKGSYIGAVIGKCHVKCSTLRTSPPPLPLPLPTSSSDFIHLLKRYQMKKFGMGPIRDQLLTNSSYNAHGQKQLVQRIWQMTEQLNMRMVYRLHCNTSIIPLLPFNASHPYHVNPYQPHGAINKHQQHHHRDIHELFPLDIFDLNGYLSTHSHASVLEYNCGSGRALLELLQKYPQITTHCINMKGSSEHHAETAQDLIDVAYHYKVSLYCNKTHYILPELILTNNNNNNNTTITTGGNVSLSSSSDNHKDGIDLGDKKFDLIYSMGALKIRRSSVLDQFVTSLRSSVDSVMLLRLIEMKEIKEIYRSSAASVSSSSSSSSVNSSHTSSRASLIKTWEYFHEADASYISVSLYVLRSHNGGDRMKSYLGAVIGKFHVKCSTIESITIPSSINSSCRPRISSSSSSSSSSSDLMRVFMRYKILKYGMSPITTDDIELQKNSFLYAWSMIEDLNSRINYRYRCNTSIPLPPYDESNPFHINPYSPGKMIDYSYRDVQELLPLEVFDLDVYLSTHSHASVLDYGCGSGKAIMQVQEKHPKTITHCIKKKEAKKPESYQDLVDVAYYYKIALHCNETHYVLPEIHSTSSLQSIMDTTALPYQHNLFGNQRFDFIYSMQALNIGSMGLSQLDVWLNQLIPLLSSSSTDSRMILLLTDRQQSFTGDIYNVDAVQKFALIDTWDYYDRLDSTYISISLYFIHTISIMPYIAADVKKCPFRCDKIKWSIDHVHDDKRKQAEGSDKDYGDTPWFVKEYSTLIYTNIFLHMEEIFDTLNQKVKQNPLPLIKRNKRRSRDNAL